MDSLRTQDLVDNVATKLTLWHWFNAISMELRRKEPFKLQPRDPALYFIQRLRDEAHRFAIGTHRAKRKRETMKNPLDEIPGIGPSRKRALLLHFGTVKAIQRAKLDDLMRTPGVNAATAKAVHDFF